MDLAKWKLEIQAVGDKIKKAGKDFYKHDKNRKNAAYKAKRLNELETDWNIFIKLDEKIENETGPQPNMETLKKEVETIYANYKTQLLLIPDNDDNDQNDEQEDDEQEDGNGKTESESTRIISKQEVRFEGIQRILDEIENVIELSAASCKIKTKLLNSYWEKISMTHEELGKEKVPRSYVKTMKDLEPRYENALIKLEEMLTSGNGNEGIKLPRIEIPKFEGDYFSWVNYRELFTSMVIKNKSLSDSQRMQILKTSLVTDSEAEKLVRDLTLSPRNFKTAWDRLQHRYENEKVIVNRYLKKLITLPHMKKEGSESTQIKNLFDTTEQILMALKNMGRPVENWDDWIVITISHKLSDELKKEWEKEVGHKTGLPTWASLKEFLEEEYRISESIETRSGKKHQQKPTQVKANQVKVERKNCPQCKQPHSLFKCNEFQRMKTEDRWNLAKKEKLCFRCLAQHDDALSCKRENPCKKCSRSHNTWLHEDKTKSKQVRANYASTGADSGETTKEVGANMALVEKIENTATIMANAAKMNEQVLLATAMVISINNLGQKIKLRALIDFGSQGSMITEDAINVLQQKPIASDTRILPLGGGPSIKAKTATVTIQPRFESTFKLTVECYCLNKLMKAVPDKNFEIEWEYIKKLKLADPKFNKIGQVDILLGADTIGQIMKSGLIKGDVGQPIAQQTEFGWIISGKLDTKNNRVKSIKCFTTTTCEVNQDLQRFWELEDLTPDRSLTWDEEKCNELYENTYSRDEQGSFTVHIPFKEGDLGPQRLGDSKKQALARFNQLENKLIKNPALKMEYVKVMNEYLQLGHMKEVGNSAKKSYYIPHHAVIKPDSLTTKTRVVFDASAKSTSGISLNECMFIGSKQQDDLFVILTRWRMKQIVFKADIEKMYRQIKLAKEDQQYHTIFWRDEQSKPIKEYQLTTVTFGTAAAPYLATRTLKKIGKDGSNEYPIGAQKLMNDFYVDDLISGTDTIEEALIVKNELIILLEKAGMKLRKWTSNNQEFLNTLPTEETEKSLQLFENDESSKTLGLQWNPKRDIFNFKVSWHTDENEVTKRRLLSNASKLFDPLGWLAPVVVKAKLFMQQVWLEKMDWDDKVPENVKVEWIKYKNDLVRLGEIEIPRWIEWEDSTELTLHGFCDGSEVAYSAVVYARVVKDKRTAVYLMAAKTRVAPKATKTTIPRLELCGAVLLKNLMNQVKQSLRLDNITQFAWSDSMVALGWIKANPGRWKTFVANRVAEIQNKDTIKEWNYVKSEENPADCASRGIMPNELIHHKLWWTGPVWLKQDESTWTKLEIDEQQLERRKEIAANVATIDEEIINRFSSWQRMVRVIARMLRWKNKKKGHISVTELQDATNLLVRHCQMKVYTEEIRRLTKGKAIKRTSQILNLNPFLDKNNVLRVGGRLQNSKLPEETKNPVILPGTEYMTRLIIEKIHKETAHGGPQLMNNILKQTYWVVRGKRAVNNVYKNCVVCKRQAGKVYTQLMGELPMERVRISRAFLHTGVDYTGGIEIRSSRLRKAPTVIGYVALFVCFSTKAVHLELVSDQTTDAFLAAMQRFVARRGLCSDMYSDNGKNFLGAANRLEKELFILRNQEMAEFVANKGVNWHFIPVNSPSRGGIWERNIGCMKNHLKKVLGTTKLTFEEYGTVLCQIEACLNSRPISPLTDDPEDLNALTPGHFLIGEALLTIPQPTLEENNRNLVHRWNHLQLLQQHFWKRWSTEYLTQLQQRYKWKEDKPNLKPGDIVLLKDDDLPPRKWVMGRISDTHPGQDGKVRTASIKLASGITKRAISKICPLLEPPDEEDLMKEQSQSTKGAMASTGEINEKAAGEKKLRKSNEKKKNTINDPENNYWNKRNLRPRPLRSALWLSLISLWILLVGVCGTKPTGQSQPITVTGFVNQPGIYLENLGHANIVTSEWHILLKIDMSKYQYEVKMLQESVKSLRKICVDTSHCSDYVNRIQNNIEDIKRTNKLIQTNGERRVKRSAPLGFIGWIEHEVFGVMAEKQAKKIKQHFDTIENNEQHLLELIKNQTTVADLTIELIKTTHDEINQNYEKIETMITKLSNEAATTDNWLGMATYLSLLAQNVKDFQDNLWNMIVDMHQGHINPHLFTPDLFINQLEKINNNLPTGSKIPEAPQDDLKSLYKLLKGKNRAIGDEIIFDIILPLVSTSEYELFKIIPVPTKYAAHQVSIVPESKFMMITLEKDKFYQLNENEYKSCLVTLNDEKICNPHQPMYSSQSNHSKCERDLLRQLTTLSPHCKLKITKDEDTWIKLQKPNEWIYSLSKERTLNVICNDRSSPMKLSGAGIMKINARCQILLPEMTITSEPLKLSKGDYIFDQDIPNLNLSTMMNEKKQLTLNFTIDHAEQLKIIHDKLNEIREQTVVEKIQHYTHFSLNLTIWIVALICGAWIWLKRHELRKLCKLMSTYTVTSAGNLVDISWRNWRLHRLTRRSYQPNHKEIQSLQQLHPFEARGQDVQVGHFSTV